MSVETQLYGLCCNAPVDMLISLIKYSGNGRFGLGPPHPMTVAPPNISYLG